MTQAKDALSDAVTPQDRAAFEADLLVQAEALDPWQLRTAVKRAAARVDPCGSGDLERAERQARREFVMYPRAGMYILAGQLDPEGAAYLSAALDPLAAPRASTLEGRDRRPPARRLGDALVDLAKRQIATGGLPICGGTPTQVIVTMTLDQLTHTPGTADETAGSAELVGGTVREPISAARARTLACAPGSCQRS